MLVYPKKMLHVDKILRKLVAKVTGCHVVHVHVISMRSRYFLTKLPVYFLLFLVEIKRKMVQIAKFVYINSHSHAPVIP